MQVTLKHGLSRSLTNIEVPEGSTVGSLAATYRSLLSLPENWTALLDGEAVDDTVELQDGDTVIYEARAASKA
jgi:hypothetical protein